MATQPSLCVCFSPDRILNTHLKVVQLMSILALLVGSTPPWKTNKIDVPCNILLNFSHKPLVAVTVDNFPYKTYHTVYNSLGCSSIE